jgi:hypothetical protein
VPGAHPIPPTHSCTDWTAGSRFCDAGLDKRGMPVLSCSRRDRKASLFFHASELAPGTDAATVASGSEVSFMVGADVRTGRAIATDVALLPKGTVSALTEDRLPGAAAQMSLGL